MQGEIGGKSPWEYGVGNTKERPSRLKSTIVNLLIKVQVL